MTDYTPTTETVRERFADGFPRAGYIQALEDFDRWLAAHDAELRERALKDAEDAAASALTTWWLTDTTPEDDTDSVMGVRAAVRALRTVPVKQEGAHDADPL